MAISSSKANIHFNNKSNVNEEVQARVQELLQGIVVDKDTLDKKLDYLNKNNIPVKKCVFYGRVSTKLREQLSSIINQASIADDFEDEYINSGFVVYEKVFEQQSATDISCDNRSSFKTEEVIHATKLYFIEVLKNEADIRNIIYKVTKDILAKQADDKSKDYKEKIEEAKKKYEIELDLVREGFVTDKSKLKELKVELDDLKQKHNISKLSSLDNYDIEAVCDKLFTSIEELVDNGFKEDAINAIKFNSLFDNIICTKDGRLIFNLKASKKLSYIGGVFGEVNR